MSRFLSKHASLLLTLLFGLAVFLFWRYRYPFALSYQEQFQLFLFDDDYLLERLAEPGGLARYIGEFLTQFYNSFTLGAVVVAILMMLIQHLTWRLMVSRTFLINPHLSFLLSFLPTIILWYAMGDESLLLNYHVALIFTLLGALIFPKGMVSRIACCLVAVPLFYWLFGPMTFLFVLLMSPWWLAGAGLLYAVTCMLVCGHLLPFPMVRMFVGISYYRVPATLPYVLMLLPIVIVLLVRCARFLPKKESKLVQVIVAVAMLGLIWLAQSIGYDAKKYELIEYDYLVRIKNWNGIIDKASKQQPDLPMSVSATNLALAMTGQLGERAFDFYQRGNEGLMPKFERNFTTSQLTGEIYFHLGLVNTAQRFAFEAMEALPNYNKSARVVKRLAETNLINGEYEVSRKYLRMLENTIFYRPWAKRTMALLGNEVEIERHPLYGTLRQYRLQEDFLYSEQELDKICGQLFIHCPQNQMATQYLLMMPLLDRDLPRFMQYAQFVQQHQQYNPRAVQEAIAFAFAQQRQQIPQGLVSPMIQQQFNDFSRLWSQGGRDNPELIRFRNTVWYYFLK